MNKNFFIIILIVALFSSFLWGISRMIISDQWEKFSMEVLEDYRLLNEKYFELSEDYVDAINKYKNCIIKTKEEK